MKDLMTTQNDRSSVKQAESIAYKVLKKTAKYVFYITLLYFAYEGFMNWE